ncbi:MAG TPA: FAD-dependent oxidoreductase [Dehalococcoidia bacterium]|nr:FAD-dependent oxidoreductase [Dehalococcoidia bacterium]
MRIAVVGAGVSGLTAAYLLSRRHEVEVFERNDYAGGHTNTITVMAGGKPVPLDTGFVIYNEKTYPLFTQLLRQLDVETQPTDMSLSVSCTSCRVHFSSRGIPGFLAQPTNILRPGLLRVGRDVLRFWRDAELRVADGSSRELTLGQYAERFSPEFKRHFLLPLGAAVWSTDPHEVVSFPAEYFLQFLRRHAMTGSHDGLRWRVVRGGSHNYVRAMTRSLQMRLDAPVTAVRRDADGVTVRVGEEEQHYDRVVLACHADEALDLLTDPTCEEREALSSFSYNSNRVVLHTDSRLLPRRRPGRASWNYLTSDCRNGGGLEMTYHLNRLQSLDGPVDYCVSVNPPDALDPASVIKEMVYEHPRYTFESLKGQQALKCLNGSRFTYFAGAHMGYGFHEDGVASAVAVANQFGIEL